MSPKDTPFVGLAIASLGTGTQPQVPTVRNYVNAHLPSMNNPLDGLALFREATSKLGIHLSVLVAETAIWTHPDVYLFRPKSRSRSIVAGPRPIIRRSLMSDVQIVGTGRSNTITDHAT